MRQTKVFPRLFTHGGILPPIWGDIDLKRGPNLDRIYHKLKVLLLLSCNYTMQFIGYNCIKTH